MLLVTCAAASKAGFPSHPLVLNDCSMSAAATNVAPCIHHNILPSLRYVISAQLVPVGLPNKRGHHVSAGACVAQYSVQTDPAKKVQNLCKEGRFQEGLEVLRSIDRKHTTELSTTCIRLLQRCTKLKLLADGRLVHNHIVSVGFKIDVFLGTTLVCMYVKCGSLKEAREVFDNLADRNTATFNIMIQGYVARRQPWEALKLYQQMRQQGVEGDEYTYVSILNVCATLRLLSDGKEVHALVEKKGLHTALYVANSIVDMYAKCGCIEEARSAFDGNPQRDLVSWNVMIGGYARQGLKTEALLLFETMNKEGLKPDPVSFVNLINTCATPDSVKEIHAQVSRCGFDKHVIVQTALLSAYCKCGSIADARKVFDEMETRDTVAWNAMLGGYIQMGIGSESLKLFIQMQKEGLKADKFTFAHIINACTNLGAAEQGTKVHMLVKKTEYEKDEFVGAALTSMYIKRGDLQSAVEVFSKLESRDVITWNTIISAFVRRGQYEEALKFFHQMQQEGAAADTVTLCSVITACSKLMTLERGREIHSRIKETEYESHLYVGTGLVSMYCKCGSLSEAREVFDRMPLKNVVTWSALIGGSVQHGEPEQAILLYKQMQEAGVEPNEVTLASILNACTILSNLEEAKKVHALINKKGIELDTFVGTALVCVYSKCGDLEDAREAFVQMSGHSSVVCWTALINGYARAGRAKEALRLFWQMQREGVRPNEVTFTSVLNVCFRPSALEDGRRIHTHIMTNGYESDLFVATALLTMYSKCGSIEDARQVYDRMPVHNVVSWTAMIGAYAYNGLDDEALNLYKQMLSSPVKPNKVTFINVLSACGNLRALEDGKEVHAAIVETKLGSDVYMGNALIDMYSKCKAIADARKVFDDMPVKDVISWNMMIKGYGLNGQVKTSFSLFQQMEVHEVRPNSATFGFVLNACAIAGALKEGILVHNLIKESGYDGELFTSNSLINMYVKCKRLQEAQQIFDSMPLRNTESWSAYFEGYADVGFAREAFKLFQQMQVEGVRPNESIFAHVLKTCASPDDLGVGKQVHGEAIECGLEMHDMVGRSLVDMYTRCGSLEDARALLERMSPVVDAGNATALS